MAFMPRIRAMKKLDEVKLNLKRTKQMGETTLGQLTIEGVSKSWFVLEPAGPDSITEGSDKRIQAGTYKLLPYSSPKYPNVYELQNVLGRTFILIHAGNYHKDTLGCLMPGKTWGVVAKSHYSVGNSKSALKEIISEIENYKKITINISNQLEQQQ
ncbi:TPA: hypothetical protein RQJ38_004424 [Vibrio vulnificus]|nr:hypothetical protein [Vibrio vulnificus]HAS6272599.1 hypothetical protein [Vibrio vulnificus]HAS6313684.1 hypothetical protein [Vibrio vulnificus]HDY7429311.1 hypothetical protein [Vibrio vulnificus]HDY7562789.1 hypothetical protein [Vibrio vulnificus]